MPHGPTTARRQPKLFELRTYETWPGRRDALIDMFERAFLDAYEAAGARILATCRDLDDPNLWTWMRAFPDAASRGEALTAFYASDVWKAGARACNATTARSRAALLLRAVSGSAVADAPTSPHIPDSLIVATIHPLARRDEDAFAAFYEDEVTPMLADLGGAPFATLRTDHSENAYPRQRIRKTPALVTLTRFDSHAAHTAFIAARDAAPVWRTRMAPEFARRLSAPAEIRRLQPTARSALR